MIKFRPKTVKTVKTDMPKNDKAPATATPAASAPKVEDAKAKTK